MFSKIFFASITDIVGGRSGSYERVLREAKATAMTEMEMQARSFGANAIIGIDLDYETIRDGMLMVTACGTAVKIEKTLSFTSPHKKSRLCGIFCVTSRYLSGKKIIGWS